MKRDKKEDHLIKQPYYKGGDKALKTFVSAHLVYPSQALTEKIEGDVHVRYSIDHQGHVIDAKIVGGIDDACNLEALRVVKLLKFIVPKTPRGLKVSFHKSICIHFRLPEPLIQKVAEVESVDSENLVRAELQFQYVVESDQNRDQKYYYTVQLG